MARFITLDALAFLLPFLLYWGWLALTRSTSAHPRSWEARTLLVLSATGAMTILLFIVALVHFGGAENSAGYRPAMLKDGQIVPGRFN